MGVAKKLEGNAAHPVNQGGLCARGQAAIQVTYHPDRITQPLKRTGDARRRRSSRRSPGTRRSPSSCRKLDALDGGGNQKSLAFITRRAAAASATRSIDAVPRRSSARPPPIAFELFGDDVLRRANAHELRPRAAADVRSRARALRDLVRRRLSRHLEFAGRRRARATAQMRQGRPGIRGTFVQVESRMSQTGANADEWVPVKPGTEGVLALGLAHVILEREAAAGRRSGRAGALDRRLVRRPGRLRAGGGRADHRRQGRAHRAARARVRRAASGGRDRSAARRSRTPTACSRRWRSTR